MSEPELDSISTSCKLILDFLLSAVEGFYEKCYNYEIKKDDIFFSEKGASNYLCLIKGCISSKSWEVFSQDSDSFLNKDKTIRTEKVFQQANDIIRWMIDNKISKTVTDEEYEFLKESFNIYCDICRSIETNPSNFETNYIEETEHYQKLFIQSLKKKNK